MPEKPSFASEYPKEQAELVRRTCLYVATKLGDLLDELVVVGGLVPSLLIPEESVPKGEDTHVGTMDLDFNNKIILEGGEVEERPFLWVKRSYRRERFTPPKNGKSRKVDMSNQLRTALKGHLIREKKKALEQGRGEIPELVFHRDGNVIEQNYIRRIFKRILSKAKIRAIKFHGLRHTFASLLLSKGESPVYVKEQLGHSSVQVTADIYGKWIQTKREAGVNRLDSTTKRNLSTTNLKNSPKLLKLLSVVPKAGLEPARA